VLAQADPGQVATTLDMSHVQRALLRSSCPNGMNSRSAAFAVRLVKQRLAASRKSTDGSRTEQKSGKVLTKR